MTHPPLPAWVEQAREALEHIVPPRYDVAVCWRPRLDRVDFSVVGAPPDVPAVVGPPPNVASCKL